MKLNIVRSSILDFPRKTLPQDLWVYEDPEDLPKMKPELREFILEEAEKAADEFGVDIEEVRIYGGAASYQWAPGTDLDVSVTIKWPDDTTEEDVVDLQAKFKGMEEKDYKGYPLHLFLKNPLEKTETADAVYNITDDEWILPPLILPQGFDPDEYFAPMIRVAERKAKKFDELIGTLRRSWRSLKKASEAREQARDTEEVEERIEVEKKIVKETIEKLSCEFIKVRESRTELHEKLNERMRQDVNVGRFERFQEPEIIWKYLDRAGYNDYLWKLYKLESQGELDDILSQY